MRQVVTAEGVVTTTVYVGNYYEVTTVSTDPASQTERKYYYFGNQRVAMRQVVTQNGSIISNTLSYLYGDHLGSTSLTTDLNGAQTSKQTYYPFGAIRTIEGLVPTDLGFTGQRHDAYTDGLMYYGARYYDPALGRFIQADTIVTDAGNAQAFSRFSYANNNPLRYTDPSGHWIESALDVAFIVFDVGDIASNGLSWENGLALTVDVGCLALPVVTGGGVAVRALFHADDAVKAVSHAGDLTKAASGLDKAVDALKAGDKVGDAARLGDKIALTAEEAQNLARISETAPSAGLTVLGKTGEYEKAATALKANSLSVAPDKSSQLTRISRWTVNKGFLDLAIARGDAIRLVSSYDEAFRFYKTELALGKSIEEMPFFIRELLYLEQQGFRRVVRDGVEYMERIR